MVARSEVFNHYTSHVMWLHLVRIVSDLMRVVNPAIWPLNLARGLYIGYISYVQGLHVYFLREFYLLHDPM